MESMENSRRPYASEFTAAEDSVWGTSLSWLLNDHLHLLLRLDPEVARARPDSGKASISAEVAGLFEAERCNAWG